MLRQDNKTLLVDVQIATQTAKVMSFSSLIIFYLTNKPQGSAG
jgi:hypothetical protein